MTREEAIKILSEYPDMIILPSDRQFDYKEACRMAIEALKERPHGEWIEKHCGCVVYYRCSNCGWLKNLGLMPYCENCGADMRKGGE